MKRITFVAILILLLLSTINVNAQDDNRILINGIVKNMNLEPIPFVNIIINKNKGMATDYNGKFIYLGKPSDTLLFSVVGYKKSKYVIPNNPKSKEYTFTKVLLADTILLKETIILPWHTYEEFKKDFVTAVVPDDGHERALKNWDLIQKQYIMRLDDPDAPSDPSVSQMYVQQKRDYQNYYKGQSQPINILNLAAWAELIKAVKRGDFNKDKNK